MIPLLLFALLGILGCGDEPYGLLPPDRTATVVTAHGQLVGEHLPPGENRPGLPGIDVYRGIPYAAPPTGDLRWKPPQQPAEWQGVREMVEFGPRCPQPYQPNDAEATPEFSEDCLTLNIWTTSDRSGKRPNPTDAPMANPVFVWIHGGGFRTGSGSSPYLDGSRFVADGTVLVTINYRLGALGFLAHPDLLAQQPEANFGLLDMSAALLWIRTHISSFGGDSGNITVFGESAGGMAVQLLMSTPHSAPFQQAISMSGYGTWPLPRVPSRIPEGTAEQNIAATNPAGNRAEAPIQSATAMGEAIIQRALDAAGLDANTDPRDIPVDALTSAVESLHLPIVDGVTLPDEPAIVFARGEQRELPFLTGGNSYDGAVMAMAGLSPEAFLKSWGPWQDELRELYAEDFAVSDELGASRLFGDGRYLLASRLMARSMDTVGHDGFLYYYDWVPPQNRESWPGAPHASELHALFNSPAVDPPDAESIAIGKAMRQAFIEFARLRAPKGDAWPPYDGANDQWYVVGRQGDTGLEANVLRDKLDFLEKRYRERLEAQGILPAG